VHDGEKLGEIRTLQRQELCQSSTARYLVFCKDHLAHRVDAVTFEEHVLGAAKTDTFRPERAGRARILRGVGIGADLHPARPVGPGHQLSEVTGEFRLLHGDAALEDLA